MTRALALVGACCLLGAGAGAATAADKKFTYVDLQPQANQDVNVNLGSGSEGNSLAEIPRGEQEFAGVKFKVEERFLQLGSPLLKEPKADTIEGIAVDRRVARLHILHSTLYGNGSVVGQEPDEGDPLYVPDGKRIGRYLVHYEDGSTEMIPIVYGRDVRDWWFSPASKGVTRGKVAWEGDNDRAKELGSRIRLYLGTWENPHPGKKVARIDLTKADEATPSAPFCIALTVEE